MDERGSGPGTISWPQMTADRTTVARQQSPTDAALHAGKRQAPPPAAAFSEPGAPARALVRRLLALLGQQLAPLGVLLDLLGGRVLKR